MFTLKLYRRKGPNSHQKMHKIITVKEVVVLEIGDKGQALELHAIYDELGNYDIWYVGEPEEGMDAFGRNDLHLDMSAGSWWGWGLLENADGKTSEHYRPASYG